LFDQDLTLQRLIKMEQIYSLVQEMEEMKGIFAFLQLTRLQKDLKDIFGAIFPPSRKM